MSEFKRTTVYLSKDLYIKAKQYALLTETSLSRIIRIALREKINDWKEKK